MYLLFIWVVYATTPDVALIKYIFKTYFQMITVFLLYTAPNYIFISFYLLRILCAIAMKRSEF